MLTLARMQRLCAHLKAKVLSQSKMHMARMLGQDANPGQDANVQNAETSSCCHGPDADRGHDTKAKC
jgi:hypothetical protein